MHYFKDSRVLMKLFCDFRSMWRKNDWASSTMHFLREHGLESFQGARGCNRIAEVRAHALQNSQIPSYLNLFKTNLEHKNRMVRSFFTVQFICKIFFFGVSLFTSH